MLFSTYQTLVKAFSGYGIGKIRLIKAIHNFIFYRLISPPTFIKVQGHEMFLDSRDSLRLSLYDGVHEPYETELVKKLIKKGNAVIDVGAHIGFYTLNFANIVAGGGRSSPLNQTRKTSPYLKRMWKSTAIRT